MVYGQQTLATARHCIGSQPESVAGPGRVARGSCAKKSDKKLNFLGGKNLEKIFSWKNFLEENFSEEKIFSEKNFLEENFLEIILKKIFLKFS